MTCIFQFYSAKFVNCKNKLLRKVSSFTDFNKFAQIRHKYVNY